MLTAARAFVAAAAGEAAAAALTQHNPLSLLALEMDVKSDTGPGAALDAAVTGVASGATGKKSLPPGVPDTHSTGR